VSNGVRSSAGVVPSQTFAKSITQEGKNLERKNREQPRGNKRERDGVAISVGQTFSLGFLFFVQRNFTSKT